MADRIRTFWDFNVGHLLVLVGMFAGMLGIYVQRERDMARIELTIQAHAAQISAIHDRVNAQDNASRKIEVKADVIINDIGWIKSELLRRARDEE
jgi:hypothetical protein